ncbi:uncharacterized protein VTP21DRAFT_5123 [Calcarisporiella thermophila]|uniref:uncharacterized protein n=1 Tax=Calcarisporiella thermophila TaxID=911321 RepID=UPI00374402AB
MPRLELIAELKGHQDRVWQVSWHPKEQLLASCSSDRTVRLWAPLSPGPAPTKWACIATLESVHKRTIRAVAWSPSGNEIATASFDATTGIWSKDTRSGEYECTATLEGHENETKSVAWSPTGDLLATCSRDKSVWIWEANRDDDFECLSVLQEHKQDVKAVIWHPNKEILASASYDDTIKIWEEDDDDWYCAHTLEGHESTVWSIDFNKTGEYLVSASDDRSIRFWQHQYGKVDREGKWLCVGVLPNAHQRCIYSISWSKLHNCIATAGGDNSICVFEQKQETDRDTEANRLSYVLSAKVENAHNVSDVNCVAWYQSQPVSTEKSDDSTNGYGYWLASAGDDGVVRIWQYVV